MHGVTMKFITGVLQVVSNDMKTHTKVLLFTGVTLNWTYLPTAKLRLKAGTSLERYGWYL